MITSATNPKIKYVKRLQNDRGFREAERAFVAEGTRLVAELVQFQVNPQLLLATEHWLVSAEGQTLLADPALSRVVEVVKDNVMSAASQSQTPPGVLAVAPIISRPLPDQPTFFLILDQLANPGNMGTILRTAAAAGVDGVLLGPGNVDAYNPKVVRGGMGAQLRLPIVSADWAAIAERTAGFSVWLAAVGQATPYTAVDWRQPSALIIGSEAAGAGQAARQVATGRVTIPMRYATESLNAAVAAGVILFEAVRQRGNAPLSWP
jgi:RNA methyltransferase, TrmH family